MSPAKICPFCDERQSYRYIVETDLMRAIYPKSPACTYHVLIIPKAHIATLDKLTLEQASQTQELLQLLLEKALQNIGLDFIGFQTLSNNGGPLVNQHVAHCHIHVFLRTKQDTYDPIKGETKTGEPILNSSDLANMRRVQKWFVS